MNPIIKNIIAVIGGWLIGSAVNLGLVQLGYTIFPLEGVDTNSMEELAAAMPKLEAQHFVFPFLAHALGTFVGAIAAAAIAANNKMKLALGLGAFFFLGGIMASVMLPAPTWFIVVDLTLAYFPMAWIAGKLALPKT